MVKSPMAVWRGKRERERERERVRMRKKNKGAHVLTFGIKINTILTTNIPSVMNHLAGNSIFKNR